MWMDIAIGLIFVIIERRRIPQGLYIHCCILRLDLGHRAQFCLDNRRRRASLELKRISTTAL